MNATQLRYDKPALDGLNAMKPWRGNPSNSVDGQWRVFALYANDVTRALNGYVCWLGDIGGGLRGPHAVALLDATLPWGQVRFAAGQTDFLDVGSARERDS